MQTIKSIGVLSVAKISGAVYAVLGLLFAPMFLLIGTISSMAGQHPNPFGAIGGVAMAVVLPVFYGVIGFVFGALGAFLYNLMAKWMGGIQLELQAVAPAAVTFVGQQAPLATGQV
jgi:hypothetical protein